MKYRIAETLGITVDDVDERLTINDVHEWNAYFSIKEKRTEKLELYLARLTHVVVSMFSKSPTKVSDFILDFRTPEDKMQEMKTKMTAWARHVNTFHERKEQKRRTR